MSSMLFKLSALYIRAFIFFVWCVIFIAQADSWQLFTEYGGFTFLGVLVAVIANATGAGGGVVFMPFFNQLEFSVATSVATSLAIQCCGMTAGAVTWWAYYRKILTNKGVETANWQPLHKVLWITIPLSILGVWLVQLLPDFFAHFSDPHSLHTGFGLFSIGLSISILATVLLLKSDTYKSQIVWVDILAIAVIALVGGGITAWLSIGVGELLAVYLIIRGFNVTFAIAAAVILTAFTVWGGIVFHIFVTKAVYWPVVLFAGLGAILGGILAKQLVLYFSPKNLKLFFAGWVFVLGLSTLPL